jgi:hypothetical protein
MSRPPQGEQMSMPEKNVHLKPIEDIIVGFEVLTTVVSKGSI